MARAAAAALREMLGPDVAVAVWGVDVTSVDPYPEEEDHVRRAVERRRVEFARGRSCARAALKIAGGEPVAIPVGPDREPRFPAGFTGSITHCPSLVAAAVARRAVASGVGLDAEEVQRLGPEVLDMVATDRERPELSGPEDACVLFSGKEAVFKAVFPLTGHWLDFQDVELEVSASTFAVDRVADTVDEPARRLLERIEGRWRRVGDVVLTACRLPPTGG